MLEFYFPKLKAKKMAEPMTGKAYRARGGSIRYGLQAQHEGSMSLPKYVPVSEYESLGFNAEEAVAALPAYEPKPAPVPADPTLDIPSESPEPAEPTNANFSAEEIAYAVSWEGKDDNNGLIYGIEYTDEDGEVADVEWFSTADERDDELSRYLEEYGAEFEATSGSGTIDHDRIDREKYVSVIMRHDRPYTDYDWDSHIDLSEEEEDELEDGIRQEVGGEPDEDDMEFYINVDTADGNHDVYVQTHTEYGSGRFYDFASEYENYFEAEIEGVVDYTRREKKDITIDQDVSQSYTVDTDPEDIPENKMDEVERAIQDEIEGIVSNDPANYDDSVNDISVDTSVEVPDEDGDMVEVSAYGYTDEPMINDENNIREYTEYESFYSESENSIHQFNGESSSCCGEPIYRYKSEGDWLCMACDFMQAEFTPEELTESSAIHGDFDHASINYSGHQNLVAQAETVMKDGVYRTTCDCGTVLTWDVGMFNAKDKDGNIIKSPPLEVERLEFPSRQFDHFEEELSIKCPTCGEYHTCYIEAPVYHDSLEVDFSAETQEFTFVYSVYDKETGDSIEESEVKVTASNEREARQEAMRMLEEGGLDDEEFYIWNAEESLIEEPDFIPEGDGRALGQQNSSINLSPLHAENNEHGCSECGKDFGDYEDDFRDCDLCGVLLCGDCNRRCEGCSNTVCDSCRDGSYCNECHEQELEESYESENLSRNAKMALGFTAIGLGIAFWKGKDLMTLWDSVKEKLKD